MSHFQAFWRAFLHSTVKAKPSNIKCKGGQTINPKSGFRKQTKSKAKDHFVLRGRPSLLPHNLLSHNLIPLFLSSLYFIASF
nr:MAG TPA: hypothetical protein [Bacteriophage sp.]